MSALATPTEVKTPEDYGPGEPGEAKRWHAEIKLALKQRQTWFERARKIVERYADEREAEGGVRLSTAKRFNVLWSNVETLKPAIYARTPKCVVQRRYNDADPVGRQACLILQRATQTMMDEGKFDRVMRQCRDDYLLVGQGVPWHRYVARFTPDTTTLGEDGQPVGSILAGEDVETDYVHWRDFVCGAARVWEEVPWVARRVYFTTKQGRKRFGKGWADVPLDNRPSDIGDTKDEEIKQLFSRAEVWEIWDKEERTVRWIARGVEDRLLDKRDDPLQLDGFFPCPCPLFATTTNECVIPIPDFVLYQDQADELNQLCERRSKVAAGISVRGLYDGKNDGLESLLRGGDNKMIPYTHMQELQQAGGVQKAVDWMPIDMFVAALVQLNAAFLEIKNELYEITGISDILRGQTQADETATAQDIKSQYATLRLSDRQAKMARFAADNVKIIAEIIARHFQLETMVMLSDYQQTMDGQAPVEQAVALLKGPLRKFRIDIETDSTIAGDERQERRDLIEFLTTFGQFFSEAQQVATTLPGSLPVMAQALLFAVRRFRVGRELEQGLEDLLAKLQAPGGLPAPQQKEGAAGDPPEVVQAKVQQIQAQIQQSLAQAEATKAKAAGDQQQAQASVVDTQSQIADRQARLELDRQKLMHEMALSAQDASLKREQQAHQVDMERTSQAHQVEIDKANVQINKDKANKPQGKK